MDKKQYAWTVSINSSNFNRTYYFKKIEERDNVYETIVNIMLRRLALQIKDASTKETLFLLPNFTVISGEFDTENYLNVIENMSVEYTKRDDLIISSLGFK
jgi:hypothetical protein